MPLDIALFREDQGGNPDLVRESQRRRHKDPEVVDEVIALDAHARKCQCGSPPSPCVCVPRQHQPHTVVCVHTCMYPVAHGGSHGRGNGGVCVCVFAVLSVPCIDCCCGQGGLNGGSWLAVYSGVPSGQHSAFGQQCQQGSGCQSEGFLRVFFLFSFFFFFFFFSGFVLGAVDSMQSTMCLFLVAVTRECASSPCLLFLCFSFCASLEWLGGICLRSEQYQCMHVCVCTYIYTYICVCVHGLHGLGLLRVGAAVRSALSMGARG